MWWNGLCEGNLREGQSSLGQNGSLKKMNI